MKNKKLLGFSLAAIAVGVIGIVGISTINPNFVNALFNRDNNLEKSLTLNSSNSVSSSGEYIKKTARGSDITMTYSGVGSYNEGHTRINADGYIVNKTQLTSIDSFVATFSGSGTLKARIAYTVDSWGDYFNLVSGAKVEFNSLPYFLEIKAFDAYVNLTSAKYTFTCEANPNAVPQDTSGAYSITFNDNGSDASTDLSLTTFWDQVETGDDYIYSVDTVTKVFPGDGGLKFASNKAEGSLELSFDSDYVVNEISTIELSTKQYGTKTSVFHVYVNNSSTYTTITPSEGGSVSVNGTLSSIKIQTSGKQAYLAGLTLNYGSGSGANIPESPDVYETGFNATDANKDKYTTNSIFDNDNALSVVSLKSNGTSSTVHAGNYSYVVKNSSNVEIDTSVKFPAIGTYTLVVTYGNYDPIEIVLNVGEYVYMVDVTASMTKTTFNTADAVADYLATNLTAGVTYSNETTETDISYDEFEQYGLGLKLSAKNIVHDIEKPFGTPGAWTLKVYCLSDEQNVYYNISLTVEAIPVLSITLNETSYTLNPEDTLQLVATVGPNNATNSSVEWSSDNDAIATVDNTGLVTAIAVGGTTITATAADGSGVYGSCVITVEEKEDEPIVDTLTKTTTGVSGTSYTSWSGKNKSLDGINSDAVYAGKSAGPASNQTGPNSIQIKSKSSDTGIITTASGGKCTKVTVSWNSDTASGGTLSVYGKSTAYSSDTDLFDSSKQGTLLGSIVNGTSTELSISGNYAFIGVRSASGALYLDSISFTWGGSSGGSGGDTSVTPVYPTSIGVTATSTSITIGETSQLSVSYEPSTTNVKSVSFSSSNDNVAGVSSTGLVTGVAQGSATITATAQAANNSTVTNTISITVNPVAVTGITLDQTTANVKVGKTVTLIATVNPSTATNKTVKWLSSATSVATVSNSGVVSGVSAGTATITAYSDTNSNNSWDSGEKKATCTVTVTTASTGEEEFSISYTDLPTAYQTGSTIYTASSGIKYQAYNCANYSKKMQFKASTGYLQNTEDLVLQSLTINDRESNSLTVYGSNTAGSFSTVIEGTNDVYDLTGYSYFRVARTSSGAAYCSSLTILTGTPTPTDPTSITLSPTSADVGIGGTKQLTVSYTPSNTNQNKEVTWTSSNTNVATVSSSGLVSVKTTATAGQTATITARLTNLTSIYATCTITVIEQQKDDHTVLIYMCGADLESGYASSNQGLATGDITEILSVAGQPDDVNIVIETGGASSWSSTYGISSSKLERWHVNNKSLVRDASLSYASMGLTSTLQSFIEYGLKNYPAERTGLIFWNHGGAMRGVCYDEKKSDDSLLTDEVASAVSGALSNCGMSGQKLEWVGYDACLMQVQDIASINSDYFNYMVASEESEAGEGWDYDTWVDDLYAKKSSSVIFKAIVDGFIKSNGGTSSSSNDQTLSYLNLSYMSAYVTAWNNMATQLGTKLTSSNKSSFNTLVKSAKHYADSDYTYYGIFDAKDFINKLAANSTFNPGSTYTNAVLTAFGNLVEYSSCGKGAGNSYGVCMFWSVSSNCAKGTYYTSAMTKFTAWRTLVTTYGS